MKVISLFAGIGGFELGFERAGFEIVAHVEKDANCLKLLASKWPAAVALDDVCTAGAHNLPPCDVIVGGSPCQGFSVAGKRKGRNDERSNLTTEFVRICDQLNPDVVVWENVPGVLSMSDNAFGHFLAAMVGEDEPFVCSDGEGWSSAGVAVGPRRVCGWRVLDAQWFGVAQRRRRVFLVGVAKGGDGGIAGECAGVERVQQILFEPEGVRRDSPPRRETGQAASVCIDDRACSRGRGTERAGETRGQDCVIPAVAGRPQERDAKGADSDTKPGHLVPCYGIDEEQNAAENLMGCLKARKEGGGFEAAVAFQPGNLCRRAGAEPSTDSFPTLGAATLGDQAPHVAASMQVRRLTPTECERLQGFPDGWTAGFSDSTRYKMLGNAVCVNVAEWIAKRMANKPHLWRQKRVTK